MYFLWNLAKLHYLYSCLLYKNKVSYMVFHLILLSHSGLWSIIWLTKVINYTKQGNYASLPCSLQFQLPILVYLLTLLSFSFYAISNFFDVNVISELIDPLYIDSIINGNIIKDTCDIGHKRCTWNIMQDGLKAKLLNFDCKFKHGIF